MELSTLIGLAAASTALVTLAFVFRHRLGPVITHARLALASAFTRPNPNATWQDAYAPRCKACGYDLRASPDHCPECGERVPPYERTVIHYLIKIGDRPPKSDAK